LLDRFLQQKLFSVRGTDVTEAFVSGCAWTIVGVGSGREPSFVDASAMPAKRIVVVRVQPQTATWKHEGAGHAARFQPQESSGGVYDILNLRSIGHVSLCSQSAFSTRHSAIP